MRLTNESAKECARVNAIDRLAAEAPSFILGLELA
jgi:hypothetical protein